MTAHALNWNRPAQMVCGVTVQGRTPVNRISELDCGRCILRILRTGQALGWDANSFAIWPLDAMAREWTKERSAQWHAQARENAQNEP